MSNLVKLETKQEEKARWPLDRCLDRIEEFEEIVVVAKVKGANRYERFSSCLNSTFWWLGAFEAVKTELMNESFTITDIT